VDTDTQMADNRYVGLFSWNLVFCGTVGFLWIVKFG